MGDGHSKLQKRRLRGASVLAILCAIGVAACVSLQTPFEARRHHRTAPVAGATLAGGDECVVCHEDVQGHAPSPAYHADCEACHGAGSVHSESEEVADIRFPDNADCLACHGSGRTTHLDWTTGDHARAGLLCSDCHNTHLREPHEVRVTQNVAFRGLDPNSNLCVGCHMDVASRLHLPSHHPVREGMLGCTDCHSPHEDRRTALGAATALCSSCHQDHAGPWIYEHPPAVEDCTTCHNPHGTPSYNLLDTSQPALCLSCHSLPDDRHLNTGEGLVTGAPITSAVGAAFYGRCTDCHGAIHGSYQDVHLRR